MTDGVTALAQLYALYSHRARSFNQWQHALYPNFIIIVIRHWLKFSGQASFTITFPLYFGEEHCIASWVMIARETPLHLGNNAKMSVKLHNIFLVPRLSSSFPSPVSHRYNTSTSLTGSLFFPIRDCNDSPGGKFHRHDIN